LFKWFFEDAVEVRMHVHEFVDEDLGHSSYVIDRRVGVTVFDGGPTTWAAASGRALEVGR
jgi:hypothetical protein